ncbi:MAG: hypothetical protein IPL53_18980 [Ignavibacteria bacterium]|nr:hypothetical protein [Ignavibacteria bacterium]
MDTKSILTTDHHNLSNGINLQISECEASLWDFMGTSNCQIFEGISSYYSLERNYESDVQAAYVAYKDALDKARSWISFFKSGMNDSPFTGVIKTKYISPALTGRSGNIEHGDHMFWVKQQIRVSIAEVTRKIGYDPEELKLHESMMTQLPHGPDPYPDPTEVHHRDQIGGIPNSIYHVYSGLINNGKSTFEKILQMTEKLMRYEVTDVTINDFLTFHNACEEYELFTFSKNHAGVRLTIPDIYQMYEDLKTTEVPELLHTQ